MPMVVGVVAGVAYNAYQQQVAQSNAAHLVSAHHTITPGPAGSPPCYPDCIGNVVEKGKGAEAVTQLMGGTLDHFYTTNDAWLAKPKDGSDRPAVPVDFVTHKEAKAEGMEEDWGYVTYDNQGAGNLLALRAEEVAKREVVKGGHPDHNLAAVFGHELYHFHTRPEFQRELKAWSLRTAPNSQSANQLHSLVIEALVSELGGRLHPDMEDTHYTKAQTGMGGLTVRDIGRLLISDLGEPTVKRALLAGEQDAIRQVMNHLSATFFRT